MPGPIWGPNPKVSDLMGLRHTLDHEGMLEMQRNTWSAGSGTPQISYRSNLSPLVVIQEHWSLYTVY
jgi:hypothetical protein